MRQDLNALAARLGDKAPQDIQGDRNAWAKAKMQRKLRQRGETNPLASLTTAQLIELIRETSYTGKYSDRLRGNYRTARPQWVEVSEKYYLYTLNALPPAEQRSLGHIMGEMFGYDGSGESLWLCFLQVCDRHRQTHYVGRICTRNEWVKAYHRATWESCQLISTGG